MVRKIFVGPLHNFVKVEKTGTINKLSSLGNLRFEENVKGCILQLSVIHVEHIHIPGLQSSTWGTVCIHQTCLGASLRSAMSCTFRIQNLDLHHLQGSLS